MSDGPPPLFGIVLKVSLRMDGVRKRIAVEAGPELHVSQQLFNEIRAAATRGKAALQELAAQIEVVDVTGFRIELQGWPQWSPFCRDDCAVNL